MISSNLLTVFIFSFIYGCSPNANIHDKESGTLNDLSIRADTTIIVNGTEFRHWLRDTLKGLDSPKYIGAKQSGTKAKEIIVDQDSLGLSIISNYDLMMNRDRLADEEDIDNLISLLREYNELPKTSFALKFKTTRYFTPSPVRGLPRDLTVEINDIELNEGGGSVVTRYNYVRGRLSYKFVTISGDKKNQYVDFLWEGNKLIKKKRN